MGACQINASAEDFGAPPCIYYKRVKYTRKYNLNKRTKRNDKRSYN